MSLYTELKASLTESICLVKHLEEEATMSDYDKITNLTTHTDHYNDRRLEQAFQEGFKHARYKAAEIVKKDEEQEVVDFNYILNEDQERVLELENELGEKDANIHELELQVADLEKTIKAHYGEN